jgi:hypothetical protein
MFFRHGEVPMTAELIQAVDEALISPDAALPAKSPCFWALFAKRFA